MRRFIVKIILALIPKRKWRQYLQSEFDFFDLNTDKIYNNNMVKYMCRFIADTTKCIIKSLKFIIKTVL